MFEWPTAIPIDLETFPRKHWYEHVGQFEIPVTYLTTQIDVSNLKAYCKANNLKFSLTLGFIITRACNHVNEFRHRIENEKPVDYIKVIPAYTVMTENKVFGFAKGVYSDNFASDYEANFSINESVAKGLAAPTQSENQGQIFITVNPWTTQTAVRAPYTKRFASVPVFCVGKMYEDQGRIKLGLGLQVHHGLVDGYHIGHFMHIVERHLNDPALIEDTFVSTFESA
jgi:chloramphenicol O-acetyltransferase type A